MRIYVDFDGHSLEFEREAFVNDGRLMVPSVADAKDAPLLALTQKKARARAERIGQTERDALSTRIKALTAAKKRIKTDITVAKKQLRKLEATTASHAR